MRPGRGTRMLALALACATASGASAQSVPPSPSRLSASLAVGALGAMSLGDSRADLRSNDPSGSPFTLFRAAVRLEPAATWQGRLAWRLSDHVDVEGGVSVARPDVTSALTADAEGAASLVAVERTAQYVLEAGAIVRPWGGGLRERTVPFLAAGVGYVRQLHEGRVLVDDGTVLYAGGGVRHRLAAPASGLVRTVWLRFDARLRAYRGGLVDRAGTGGAPMQGEVSGGVQLGF